MSTIIPDAKVDFWITNNYNVLLKGAKGVGKSSIVIKAFERHNLRWKYFSAATLDPWVDFIGAPKERIDENGNPYLDLVRPKAFMYDEVDAIFIDEYNRSHKKVRNAIMELMQFKSINGKKFNNLRFIWAAINPYDAEKAESEQDYDVEKLDPAQEDRFEIIYDIPNNVDRSYFISKYGTNGSVGCDWWTKLDPTIKDKLSPRRLDYMLGIYSNGGDMRDAIPGNVSVNVRDLVDQLKNGSILTRVAQISSTDDIRKFLESDPRVLQYIIKNSVDMIKSRPEIVKLLLPHIDHENVIGLLSSVSKTKDVTVLSFIESNIFKNDDFIDLLVSIPKGKLPKSTISDRISSIQKEYLKKNPIPLNYVAATTAAWDTFAQGLINHIDQLANTNPNTYFKDAVLREINNFITVNPVKKGTVIQLNDPSLIPQLNLRLANFVGMYQSGSLSGYATGMTSRVTRQTVLKNLCRVLGTDYSGNRHGLTP